MNITEIMQTKKWKGLMGFVYGWGAAIVMIGALFKLQHWPHSGIWLTVGLTAEALIFFLSAFEPSVELPDWGRVYPELREDYVSFDDDIPSGNAFADLLDKSEITPELLSKVGKSLSDLSNTASGLTDITTATVATDVYVKNLNAASESMGTLSEINNKANESINESVEGFVGAYKATTESLSHSGRLLADELSTSGKKLSEELVSSGELLSKSYREVSEHLIEGFKSLDSNSKDYDKGLGNLNKNLSALNAAYELQLKSTETHNAINEKYASDVEALDKVLGESLKLATRYKDEAQKLNENLEALNSVYGNMLGAMSYKNRK